MSQIQTPTPPMCEYLIEHLPSVGEFEELEALDMADAIRRGDKKTYDVNAIVGIIPYLVRAGILSYERRQINSVQSCFFYKRAATPDIIKKTLSQTPSLEALKAVREEGEKKVDIERTEKKKRKKKNRKKKNRKKKKLVADRSPLPTKKKKKKKKKLPLSSAPDEGKVKVKKKKRKKCCDDPRIVRSKKTGKRRCKNCGAKFKKKKKKTVDVMEKL